MTTPQRWQEIDRIFAAALEREPAERAAFLGEACAGDELLRQEVESLLANDNPESLAGADAVQEAQRLLKHRAARMAIPPNSRLGRYEIRSQIGSGGMGEVYLARDPKINRDVAIKVLPAAFSSDSERLRRFEQEAQAVGALNHPNILSIYDVDTHEGSPYLVSELLEGETLREQLNGAALPVGKSLDYAFQIASGLAAAHAKGIVHRDLKPDNLFITREGRVKILDFGIAKLIQPRDASVSDTELPTRILNTQPGMVMGTVGYMSPEQVKGLKVDHRSDIFSLGVILYEMLSGKRAFHCQSAIETLNAILKEDPPELSQFNGHVNASLERVVKHCLEKSAEHRFQSATDVAFSLEALSGLSSSLQLATASVPTPERPQNYARLAWVVAGVCLLGLLAALPLAIAYLRRPAVDERVLKVSLLPPEKVSMAGTLPGIALSPDGRRLAFIASLEGRDTLFVRSLDSLSAQALPGTEGAAGNSAPFWSPDSRFIGFSAGGKLKKIDASGGPPQTVCDAASRGGTWNRDGVIIFGSGASGPLFRVSAAGGEPSPVTTLDQARSETSHRWPFFLPDGKHFLYFVRSNQAENGGVYAGSLDGKETKRLLPATLNAAYAPPGFLLFLRNETLMAQRFDAGELQLSGEPFPVAEHVAYNLGLARGDFSVSENGVLAYRSGSGEINQPFWFDREGKQIGSLGKAGLYFTLWLSPDESRAAMDRSDPKTGTNDIWLFDLSRDLPSRFTTDPGGESNPLWSPDGSRIVFVSNRDGVLYQKMASGGGNQEVILKSPDDKVPDDWSADGQFIVYETLNPKTKRDLWVLPVSGDRKPFPFLQTEFDEQQAQFSPDGKWIVYTSDESGGPEIYAQRFPAAGDRLRVSTAGGCQPKWRRDGKELFYIATDRKLMAVDIKMGDSFVAGVPHALFGTRVLSLTDFRSHYSVSGDGQRFLINSTIEEIHATPISVVVNWTADLKR
ncbi:MAG: protein kinase [Pyrinomonadaceae bacterium]